MTKIKNILKKAFLIYMVGVMSLSSFGVAHTVNAQYMFDSVLGPLATKETVEKAVKKPLEVALLQILVNLISFVANRLAYDAAMAIASGGKGQTPGYEYRSVDEYMQDLGEDIVGEAVSDLSGGLGDLGVKFDLCAPANPQLKLNIQMGLVKSGGASARPEPKCEFRSIASNWEGFVASAANNAQPDAIYKQFASQFKMGGTDLSSTIGIFARTANEAANKEVVKTDELLANDRFKDVTDVISGNVKTPSSVLKDQFKGKLNAAEDNKTEALQQAMFGSEGAMLQVGLSAGSVFLNTLLSQLTSKVYSGLFEPPTTGGVFNPDFINVAGRDSARETFKDLLTSPIMSIDDYDIVTEQFLACPGADSRGLNNCVMDPEFGQVVALAEAGVPRTVQSAIDDGFLRGDWPLISDQDRARNEDPYCFTNGYCYSNIVKMRVARILPVGWELAATKSQVGSPATLQEVIDGFDDCNIDNPDKPLDAEHPWCHLIDPNWVIKYPETQCKASVTGSILLTANSDVRAETCVDSPSCLEEDEDGNCIGGFGYCTRERNTWRFDGDACPAQFASCLSLTSRTGSKSDILTNTVDFADCDADSAGCRWYNTVKELSLGEDLDDPADDAFVFDRVAVGSDAEFVAETATVADENSRQYFNYKVASCGSGDNGCTELINGTTGSLNPIMNASFEQDSNQDDVPDGWFLDGAIYNNSSSNAAFGADSVAISGDTSVGLLNPVHLYPNQFVTISYHARRGSDVNATARAELTFGDSDGNIVTNLNVAATSADKCQNSGNNIIFDADAGETYTRSSCTFSTGDDDVWMLPVFYSLDGSAVFIDAVQIDEREITSPFHTGYSEQDITHIKIAPDYLGCNGDATDPAECANFAQVCSSAEVGCTAYTPTNGNPTIPGIVNSNDYCPEDCVGYETYRQLGTNFSKSVFPTYFIADSADVCSAQFNGCSEFTNLDALAEGGEALEYFTDVRVCQEVDEAKATNTPGKVFYTWEGSEVEGFQIRTWTLKGSNNSGAPCTNFNAATGNCQDSGYIMPSTCNEHSDIFTNPDCREFYNESGDIYFRLFSETVTVDNACSPYRKTLSNKSDCNSSNGVWNDASGNCSYNIMPAESVSCPATDNGCRGYIGNTGNNTRVAYSDLFEEGSLSNWESGSGVLQAEYSSESVANDGHSMKISNLVTALDTQGQFNDGYEYIISFWAKGSGNLDVSISDGNEDAFFVQHLSLGVGWQEYELGPLNLGTTSDPLSQENTMLTFDIHNSGEVFVDNIVLREIQDTSYLIENSWVTPASCDATFSGAPAPQFFLGCSQYNTHRGDQVNLKSFSSIGRESAVGCESFYDTKNSSSYNAEAFGLTCTSSDGTAVQTPTACEFNKDEVCTILSGQSSCKFNYTGVDMPKILENVATEQSEIVERDEKVFIVDSPEVRCNGGVKGCAEFGLPSFNIDKTLVESFESVFLLDQPDKYDHTLCESNDLFCESYSTTEGSQYFFKDPGPQTCEWTDEVLINGQSFFGWVKTGTDEACDPDYVISGSEYGLWNNGDLESGQYTGWVGTCDAKWNMCSEFIDVADTSDGLYPDGKPYNFLKNNKLSEVDKPASEKCDGLVSQEKGCVTFNDTSVPYLTMSSSASYIKSKYAHRISELNKSQFAPVTPVSCPLGGVVKLDGEEIDLCARRCRYELATEVNGNATESVFGGSCVQSSDCGTRDDAFGLPVAGTCTTGLTNDEDKLANDANSILKVRRDRSCSEWLACSAGMTAFDSLQNKYVNVCNQVSLCNEFTTNGDNTFCSNWTDQPLNVLDEDAYAARDITWYGSEYSGYSIANQHPVESYTQINVNPDSWCTFSVDSATVNDTSVRTSFNEYTDSWINGIPVACTNDSDCEDFLDVKDNNEPAKCTKATEDFRLGVNVGPCVAGAQDGSVCKVGVCETSGLACSDDTQCGGGTCKTSVDVGKKGVCYGGICAQNVAGDPFTADNTSSNECRAYPEDNSPFPWEIVTSVDDRDTDALFDDRASGRATGFNQASLCANGESCECSYKKVTYGTNAKTMYVSPNEDLIGGLCVGGQFDGMDCNSTEHGNCGNGTCEYKTTENTYVGWEGLCIQRDGSIRLNGSSESDDTACLLWLPVDELMGGTDIHAKFTEAGFPINNTAYCVEQGIFVDVGTTGADVESNTLTHHCAESLAANGNDNGGTSTYGCNEGEFEGCWSNISCPGGYYAIVAPCDSGADLCVQTDPRDDDCPYFCVPEDSFRDDGTECTPPGNLYTGDKGNRDGNDGGTSDSEFVAQGFDTYSGMGTWQDYNSGAIYAVEDITPLKERYISCRRNGLRWKAASENDPVYAQSYYNPREEPGNDVYNYTENHSFYLGCVEYVYTSAEEDYSNDSSVGNAAFTNRLLLPGNEFAIPDLGYTGSSQATYAGRVQPSLIRNGDNMTFGDVVDQVPLTTSVCTKEGEVLTSRGCVDGYTSTEPNHALSYGIWEGFIPNFNGSEEDHDYEPYYTVKSTAEEGTINLRKFFAKIYSHWRYDDGTTEAEVESDNLSTGRYEKQVVNAIDIIDDTDPNVAPDGLGEGANDSIRTAPVVRGLGEVCIGTNCTEGPKNTISVNGFTSQDFATDGSFLADVRFFATTDPNQFPLRKVIVDWGSGTNAEGGNPDAWGRGDTSGSTADDNYYKAHRGLDDSDPTDIKPFCTDIGDTEWGLTSDSCEQGPFHFVHHYRCTAGLQQWLQTTGRNCEYIPGTNVLKNSPCWEDACVFQPRVHVLDNWGYCTGFCYDGPGGDEELCYGETYPNTCNYSKYPNVANENNPWVNYGGLIRVSP